jgi:hypothetical protein
VFSLLDCGGGRYTPPRARFDGIQILHVVLEETSIAIHNLVGPPSCTDADCRGTFRLSPQGKVVHPSKPARTRKPKLSVLGT